jgi:hypothetical protein
MLLFGWIITIAAITGSVVVLFIEKFTREWSEAVPPWFNATPDPKLHFESGFGSRS